MNKALTLSLIIPAYNEEHHLKDCLDSIAKQTVKPDEVLVVDNNSNDQTAKVALSYRFVSVITEKNQGMIFARDTGFAAASGSLLGRIDADTVLPSDWAEKVLLFYADGQNNSTALSGSGYFKNVRYPQIHKWFIDGFFLMYSQLLGQAPLWGPNMVVPAVIWEDIKRDTCSENSAIYEDIDITLHLQSAGYKTVRHPELRVGTRQKHLRKPLHMLRYISRLSTTLKNHHNWRWVPAAFAVVGIFVFQYPFLYALRTGENE